VSDDRVSVSLCNPQQAWREITAAWQWAKAMLMAGHLLMLDIRLQTRTLEQNAFFHKLCDVIAKSGVEWAGKRRTSAQWKVLLVSGHGVATKEGAEMVPGLEGEFVNIRESTAQMSVRRSSSLIEYTLAFCATHDVKVPARVDPKTGEILGRSA